MYTPVNLRKSRKIKLLLFFGGDVRKTPDILLRAYSEGYTLLSLDVPAIGIAVKLGVPYTLIEDWLDPMAISRATERATECEQSWHQEARDEFTSEGICWPEFDSFGMFWFWRDVMLALEVAKVFQSTEIQEIRFFVERIRRPAVYYSPSDVFTSLLEAEFPHLVKVELMPSHRRYLFVYNTWHKFNGVMRRIMRRIRTDETQNTSTTLRGKVVLAFNPGELYRFTPIIRRLTESMPGKVGVAIISPNQSAVNKISAEFFVPAISAPTFRPAGSALGLKFIRGYMKALEASKGQLWEKPLKHLQFHFNHYCVTRWPTLVSGLHFWSELWGQVRPKAVIVSQLPDSESQLPAEAARRLGVPTFAIPHGAGPGNTLYLNKLASKYILYAFPMYKPLYECSGVGPERLIGCQNITVENEYPAVPIQMNTRPGMWRVLALTDLVGVAGYASPLVSRSAQLKALRALGSPPKDLCERLSLRVKVHPAWPDLEIFYAAGGELIRKVLPPNSELSSVLKETDLVVAVNYWGSALVHVLRAGKPVIFFWTDPLIGKVGVLKPAHLFLAAGILVRDEAELWKLVRTFFADPEVAKRMRHKAQEFSRNNLDTSNYPSISEVLNQVLLTK